MFRGMAWGPRSLGLVLFVFSVLLVGCGGGLQLHPVKGRVLLGGNPITVKPGETAVVEFHPDPTSANKVKVIPRGVVDAQGNYEMKTGEKDGAPAGAWVVTVTHFVTPSTKDADMYAPPKVLIDAKYGIAATTPLKKEIPGSAGDFDLTVTK